MKTYLNFEDDEKFVCEFDCKPSVGDTIILGNLLTGLPYGKRGFYSVTDVTLTPTEGIGTLLNIDLKEQKP